MIDQPEPWLLFGSLAAAILATIYGFEKPTANKLKRIADASEPPTSAYTRPLRQPQNIGGGNSVTRYRFELTEDYAATNPNSASAIIRTMGGTSNGTSTVNDPEGIFSGLTSGTTGYCDLQDGAYYITNANCPA